MGVLLEIERAGFSVKPQGGNLVVMPASRLSQEMCEFIRENKPQILNELKARDIHEAIEEKAAILEYEAGMPRQQAEKRAPGAVGAFNYVLADCPGKVFTMLSPGSSLAEARRLIEHQYGVDRVVDVQLFPWRP